MGFCSIEDPQKWLSEPRLTFGMTDFDFELSICL